MPTAKDRSNVTSDARHAASDIAKTATREGKRLTDSAKQRANEAARAQQEAASDYLQTVSKAAAAGSRVLHDEGYQENAELLHGLAGEIDRWAERIAHQAPAEILREIEDFAHRRPALFFGAAFLTGIGAGRFLKSARPPQPATGHGASSESESTATEP